MRTKRLFGIAMLAILPTGACSASSAPAGRAVGEGGGGGSAGSSGAGGISLGGTGLGGSETGGTSIIPQGGTGGTAGGSGPVCGVEKAMATLVRAPVDIIVILDNSGSMEEEMGAAEANINVNFAHILASNSVDYRIILLSRHRDKDRSASEAASTSICVAAPLSGLASCPAPDPVFSERFFQYDAKVESDDSFDKALLWYDLVDDDDDSLVPNGWGPFLRAGAKKVFVEMTDDDEDMPAADFIAALSAKSAENFGTPSAPTFVFHSIIGIEEKANPTEAYLPSEPVEMATCTGNGAVIENAGLTYQELSIRTGGLRFPLCQFPGYDAVFRRIAEDVVVTSRIDCAFPIPEPPPGTELDLSKVAVSYAPGDGSAPVEFGQVLDPADCQKNAFHISADGTSIELCDEACSMLQKDAFATVDVLFKCESTILPPR